MSTGEKFGYVYLLYDNSHDNFYKIGVTRGSIDKRIKKLQTGNAGEINVCKYYKTQVPFFIEKWLHTLYLSKKVRNEWFELTDKEVMDFENRCKEYEEMYFLMEGNPFFKNKRLK